MHIPDGYLGPYTYIAMWIIMIPIWYYAGRKLSSELKSRQVPLLALAAAFSFIIMMFNLPVPGGSTGHAVGGAIIGIVLGPWAALISISVALIIQCLVFGDGGFTTLAANCFNIAFILPFSAYYIYKFMSGNSDLNSSRRLVAAAIAGYTSLVLAAGITGFMFGIQPLLHRNASGLPEYMPFDLNITLPFMLLEHLLFFGVIEALVTVLVFSYIRSSDPTLLKAGSGGSLAELGGATGSHKAIKPMAAFLLILIVLTPLGLLAAGDTFGEWGPEELKEKIGFVPPGLEQLSSLWNAPMPDYAFPGGGSMTLSAAAYILSAIIGVIVCSGLLYLLGKRIAKD